MNNNIIIRKPNIDDISAIAEIHVDTWRTTHTGIISDDYLENLNYEQSENQFLTILTEKSQKEFLLVAEKNKIIIGFAGVGKERTGNPDYSGELYGIYVTNEYQRQGCGQKLISAVIYDFLSIRGESS